MKIEDLRIGNIVGINGSSITNEMCVSEILTISNVGNYFCDLKYNRPSKFLIGGYTGCFVNDLIPIPLTEKILLKCGFSNLTEVHKRYFKHKDIDGCLFSGPEYSFYEYNNSIIDITYLHELQNLHYSLTKKKLPIDINKLEL